MTNVLTNVADLEMPELDFSDPVVVANPQAAARELAKDHWIARTSSGYALLRWDDCKVINRDKRFRTPEGLGLSSAGITDGIAFEWASGTVLGLDGADHERIRRLAQPGFAPKQLDELRPEARALFAEILDEALPRGRGEAADVCMSYSVRMICRLLGWPEEDWRKILAWSDAAIEVASLAVGPDELVPIEEALVEMREYTSAQLEELRGAEAGGFAAAIIADDGDAPLRQAPGAVAEDPRRPRPDPLRGRGDPPLPRPHHGHRPGGPRRRRVQRRRLPRRDLRQRRPSGRQLRP